MSHKGLCYGSGKPGFLITQASQHYNADFKKKQPNKQKNLCCMQFSIFLPVLSL